MQLDAEYEELQRDVVRPPLREHPANSWITAETWKLVNHCALLRRKGMLSQATSCGLGWQIKARLVADCLLPASNTTSEIKGNLTAGELVEAWHHLKGWYRSAEDQAPKACPETLALQMVERVELYMVVPPPWVVTAHQHHPHSCPWQAPNGSRNMQGGGKPTKRLHGGHNEYEDGAP